VAGKTFVVRLITPMGKLIDAPALSAQIPAHDGLMGFLPNRAAIVVKLGNGPMRVEMDSGAGGSREYFVEEGFAQMANNRLTVLTSKATETDSLVESTVQAEVTAVEAKTPAAGNRMEAERYQANVTKVRAKLAMAKGRRGKGN